jgi:hypothetical protein
MGHSDAQAQHLRRRTEGNTNDVETPDLFTCGAASACGAQAQTTWTNWTAATNGTPGSATGTVGGVGVSYAGELNANVINGSSTIWSPNSSFIGGTVTASPSVVGDDLRLAGAPGTRQAARIVNSVAPPSRSPAIR